ncbi:MAG TPA: 4-(cytidine 5'-diphospho)-2-C-methyl-D-erythritol kinase [Bacteroidales bacterium]|nr:4-(cytidine 5'-diphospho)-2-C-methyl-D-erythritol kinase [Bacteroidales bacterium]
MVIFPRAKINIGLRITGKRDDGYHNLETVFYPVRLCDALEFVVPEQPVKEDELACTGIAVYSDPEDNLVIKALRKMREYCDIPFIRIHLHKIIPSGAGLGGGSSDAAAFLKVLNRYFCFRLKEEELKKAALELGSDCPFFIYDQPCFAEGRGEILTPVDKQPDGLHLIILKPDIHVSTRDAFEGCMVSRREDSLVSSYNAGMNRWRDRIGNDFEKTVFPKYPVIRELKEALYKQGAIYSSMSGSGSAVYGIFAGKPGIPDDISKYVVYSGIL